MTRAALALCVMLTGAAPCPSPEALAELLAAAHGEERCLAELEAERGLRRADVTRCEALASAERTRAGEVIAATMRRAEAAEALARDAVRPDTGPSWWAVAGVGIVGLAVGVVVGALAL